MFQYLLKDLLIPHLLNAIAIPLLISIVRIDVLIMENSLQEERNWHICHYDHHISGLDYPDFCNNLCWFHLQWNSHIFIIVLFKKFKFSSAVPLLNNHLLGKLHISLDRIQIWAHSTSPASIFIISSNVIYSKRFSQNEMLSKISKIPWISSCVCLSWPPLFLASELPGS